LNFDKPEAPWLQLLMSLNILIETPSGFNCTGADYQRWMAEAGFPTTSVVPLVGPLGVVVAIKRS